MATIKEKQAFLKGLGLNPSLSYFMTGPVLGPSWDWDKAIAGGFSQVEIEEFVAKGQSAYAAKKAADKAKKADPGLPGPTPSVGGACAKTAAKTVVSALSEAAQAAAQAYHLVFGKGATKLMVAPSYPVPAQLVPLRKKVDELLAQISEEVGEAAPEFQLLRGAKLALDSVQDMADAHALVWSDSNPLDVFSGLAGFRKKMMARLSQMQDVKDAVTVGLAGVDDKAGAVLFDMVNAFITDLDHSIDLNLKKLFQTVDWQAVGGLTGAYAKADIDSLLSWAEGWVAKVTASAGSEGVAVFREVAEQLQISLEAFLDTFEITTSQAAEWFGTTQSWLKVRVLLKDMDDWISDSLTPLKTQAGWLDEFGGPGPWLQAYPEADLLTSPLQKYYQARDFVGSATHANFSSQKVPFSLVEDVPLLKVSHQKALEASMETVPGATPTPAAVAEALSGDFVELVKKAGTDELNPLVQKKLTELGEQPSLTYFMSKSQKQDFLLMPWEEFQQKSYTVKVSLPNGASVNYSDTGLGTAVAKYQVKQGNVDKVLGGKKIELPHSGPAAAGSVDDAVAAASKTPPLTKTGINPVTGIEAPIPAGSPSWYSDPITQPQIDFLDALFEKAKAQGLLAESADTAIWDAVNEGAVTKGQASHLITAAQDAINFKAALTNEDLVKALNYGVSPQQLAEDVAEAIGESKHASMGPVVTGQAQKAATAAAPDNPVWDTPHDFTYRGDGQSKWGGAHRKWWFQDETGTDWMLKHGEDFRLEGELAAHKVAHLAGFDVAEARIASLSVDGSIRKGFLQRMYRSEDIVGNLDDVEVWNRPEIMAQLQEHQVLDWLIGNHDSHTQNFLLLSDGRLVGVDKGQAFKFYGKDVLSHDYSPPGNHGTVAYNRMWRLYREGRIDLDLDSIDDALSRVEKMSDEQLADLVSTYAQGRFRAGTHAGFLNGTTATTPEELVELVLERRRGIRGDFEHFYREQARARGVSWEPAWGKPLKPAQKAAGISDRKAVLTPIDDDFAAALNRVGTNGKAVYVAGTEVVEGQILFDVVRDELTSATVLRMNAYLRPDGDAKIMAILQADGGGAVMKAASSAGGQGGLLPTSIGQWPSKVVEGAKTINYHIGSGDFAFNQKTLDAVRALQTEFKSIEFTAHKFLGVAPKWKTATGPSRWKLTESLETITKKAGSDAFSLSDEVLARVVSKAGGDDAALVTWVTELSQEMAKAKGAAWLRPHVDEIVEMGSRGTAAAKVSMVPSIDMHAEFEAIRTSALKRARELRDAAPGTIIDDVPEPVFREVESVSFTTSVIKLSPSDDAVATFTGFDSPGAGARTISAKITVNGREATVLYRTTQQTVAPTQQGWLEVVWDIGDRPVSAEDVSALHRWLTDTIGVDAKLANYDDMELLYWRMVQGSYQYSREIGYLESGPYWDAWTKAKKNLEALGPKAKAADEVEAIRSAYREVFGSHVDAADVLPIHSRRLSDDFEEIGWGFFERPELTDADLKRLEGFVARHRISGSLREEHLSGATGQGLVAQQDRIRMGYGVRAKSAEADIETGGASGSFASFGPIRTMGFGGDEVIINPVRRWRRLLDYNSSIDSYGRLAWRSGGKGGSDGSLLTPQPRALHEIVMRNLTSYTDDVEVVFFSSQSVRDAWVAAARRRGVTSIRGVPVEERWVYAPAGFDRSKYVDDFFKRHVDYGERLRRDVSAFTKAPQRRAAQEAVSSRVESRLSVKGNRLTKKLSVGREVRIYPPGSGGSAALRYHVGENAISVPEMIGNVSVQTLLEQFSPPGMKLAVLGDGGYVMDLSVFGIDIKLMQAGRRTPFLTQLFQAWIKGSAQDIQTVLARYGGSLPVGVL
jgi:hypothetical protein